MQTPILPALARVYPSAMCEAPSTWRARIWAIEPRFFSAEYSGLIAAPGTPKAQTTPSLSRIRTAASIARIFAISRSAR
jgi:hypothetical protein